MAWIPGFLEHYLHLQHGAACDFFAQWAQVRLLEPEIDKQVAANSAVRWARCTEVSQWLVARPHRIVPIPVPVWMSCVQAH